MDNKLYKKRLLTLVLFVIGGIFLSSLFLYSLAFIKCNFIINKLPQGVKTIQNSKNLLGLAQISQSFLVFIIPSLLLPFLWKEKIKDFLSLNKTKLINYFIAIFSTICSIPLINFIALWNSQLHLPGFMQGIEKWMINSENMARIMTDKLLGGNSISDLFFSIIIVAILAAVGEEFFFRGLLQRMVKDRFNSNIMSIWVVAIIFSAFHLQFFGFFPRLLLGAWFGYLLIKTNSIWVPITAHFINNAFSIIIFHIQKTGIPQLEIQEKINSDIIKSNSFDTIGPGSSSITCIASMICILICVWALNKYNEIHY